MPRKSAPSLQSLRGYGQRIASTSQSNGYNSQSTIGPVQVGVLALLATTRSGKMSAVDIGIFMGRSRQVFGIADSLVRRGLLTRHVKRRNRFGGARRGGNPGEGSVDYSITAAGRTLLGRGQGGETGAVLPNAPSLR